MTFIKSFAAIQIFIITCFAIACNNSPEKPTGDINIVDVRNSKEPEVNLASHKPHDVEVFRVTFLGEGYKVRYYPKEEDKLASYEASYMKYRKTLIKQHTGGLLIPQFL